MTPRTSYGVTGARHFAPQSTASERFPKGQQAVVGTEPAERCVHRLDLGERLFLHGQIRVDVTLVVSMLSCPSHTAMTALSTPACSKAIAVPQRVRRDPFLDAGLARR